MTTRIETRPEAIAERAASFYNTPLMIAPDALRKMRALISPETLQALISGRASPEQLEAFTTIFWRTPEAQPIGDPVRIVRIVGPLFRGSFFDDYGDIRAHVDAALEDPNVRGLILDIDSPGGTVSGLFDLAEHNLESRNDEKPMWALANDRATSAAYAIASACD